MLDIAPELRNFVTSYLIPITTKGDKLTYAVKFLQYMTSPTTAEKWIYDELDAEELAGEVGRRGRRELGFAR